MFTCRKELEEILGLKHPRRVVIEESGEVPRAAEKLFRGVYTEPEKLKRSFSELHRETVSVIDQLAPRRNRFREWLEELPVSPTEALEYIKETAVELRVRQERAALAEARVLSMMQELNSVDLFPIEKDLLAKWSPDRIILFSRVIEKVASLLKLSYDNLNKVILVHMMAHVLIYAGEDRDKRTWARDEIASEHLDSLISYFSNWFYQAYDYKELAQLEAVIQRFFPGNNQNNRELSAYSREQVVGALIFWRRKPELNLRDLLRELGEYT